MKEVVAKGSELLDTERPGWWTRIDLEVLDMASGLACVLGQEFGTFSHGKDELGVKMGKDYGFALPADAYRFNAHLSWKELRKLWVEEIEARLLRDELDRSPGVSSEAEEELALT